MHNNLTEIHSIGARTRERIVTDAQCPAFSSHGMLSAGISDAVDGFKWLRPNPDFSLLMVCSDGSGEALVDGRMRRFASGMAYVAPPRIGHAYQALRRGQWRVCWLIYKDPPNKQPAVAAPAPVLTRIDPRPFHDCLAGLYRESIGAAEPAMLRLWAELLHAIAMRAVRRWRGDDRLWQLWESVDAALDYPWTLEALAEHANMSGENIRRLCLKQLRRSPMDHVAFLRMRRACTLLSNTPEKIETIARNVGYENIFSFSAAFKRRIGLPPSRYRSREGG